MLILSPFTGAAIGSVVAYVAMNMGILYDKGNFNYAYSFAFASGHGGPMGFAVGGTCGLLAFLPLRRSEPLLMVVFLCGGTLAFGLFGGVLPGGVGWSMILSIVGFWVGFAMLRAVEHDQERRSHYAPEQADGHHATKNDGAEQHG